MVGSMTDLEESIVFLRDQATGAISDLRLYLTTLERLIDQEESRDVSKLKEEACELPQERQADFWEWHYPTHWAEIFATQLRCSVIVSALSIAEWHLDMIGWKALRLVDAPLKPTDLRGGFLDRSRRCLQVFAGFQRPTSEMWSHLQAIADIRNCIVHHRGWLLQAGEKDRKRIEQIIGSLPGVTVEIGLLQLGNEFPSWALDRVEEFTVSLYDEIEALQRRVGAWRPGK